MSSVELDLPHVDDALANWIRQGLERIEDRLASTVTSDDAFLSEAARHLFQAGGKRFRPLVTLLAAQFGDREASGVIPAALVVEVTHVATLYHDDVMDGATLRRGATSANERWSNTVAILTGDYLFARASSLVADLGQDCVYIQAETFARLVQGQLRETVGPASGEDPLGYYLDVVADKTASLIATSAQLGARTAGTDRDVEQLLTEFGEKVGIAFQLSDDVLDIASDSVTSGKTPGTDLREGIPTLPVLLAQQSEDPADGRLRELLSGELSDDARHQEALTLLRKHSAMSEAQATVRRSAEEARAILAPLPEGSAKAALAALCDLVVSRTG